MEAIGPVLIVLSIPLLLRWVPRNRFVGFRLPPACTNDSVWYDTNALHGRHLFLLGLFMVALEFVLPLTLRVPVLATVGWIGVTTIVFVDWRAARRLLKEQGAGARPAAPGTESR